MLFHYLVVANNTSLKKYHGLAQVAHLAAVRAHYALACHILLLEVVPLLLALAVHVLLIRGNGQWPYT